jgi:succinate dehydrogenase / fumarate reductase flavoprotein subunit
LTFWILGELIALDAWHRHESCGAHFREEYQTPDGEAKRGDENYAYVAAWEYSGVDKIPVLHQEKLTFDEVKPTQRSYK